MLIYQNAQDRPHSPSVVSIGSFDGLHRGHIALIKTLKLEAARLHLPNVVYTFDLPTRVLLQGSKFLYSLAEKLELFAGFGLDEVIAVPFTTEFAARSKEDFLNELRVLQPQVLVVGDDFRFGQGRAGGLTDLSGITSTVHVVPTEVWNGEVVKSSLIREALQRGDVGHANALLGRVYSARGVVVHGRALGRTIGFPTANVAVPDGKLLPPGVFVVRLCLPGGGVHFGMANVGKRPTVNGESETLEVFVFDFAGDLYGLEARVEFLHKLRNEQRFDGLPALIAQLEQDKAAARRVLAQENLAPKNNADRT